MSRPIAASSRRFTPACAAESTLWDHRARPTPAIVPAPAFTAEALRAAPAANRITNGGSVRNQRYSPLDQIDRETVAQLKALWRTSMGSADGFRNSGQAQILAWEGTLFVINGENDVFAIDADTGEILWRHRGVPDGGSGNPLGWTNRGAALGDVTSCVLERLADR